MGNEELDRWMVLLGILTASAGQLFRFAVIGFAYIKRGGKEGKVYADELVIRCLPGTYAPSFDLRRTAPPRHAQTEFWNARFDSLTDFLAP